MTRTLTTFAVLACLVVFLARVVLFVKKERRYAAEIRRLARKVKDA